MAGHTALVHHAGLSAHDAVVSAPFDCCLAVQYDRLRLPRVRGVPLAREASSFSNLGRVHQACSSVATVDSVLPVLSGIREAARSHQMCACTSSCGTPLPLAYMNPS